MDNFYEMKIYLEGGEEKKKKPRKMLICGKFSSDEGSL
jgi:hypothetical protein